MHNCPHFQCVVLSWSQLHLSYTIQALKLHLPVLHGLIVRPYRCSSAIPCHYQDTDIKMESMLVRHVGALWRAMHSLDTYYQEYSANPSLPLRKTHPYPTSFISRDGSVQRFTLPSALSTSVCSTCFETTRFCHRRSIWVLATFFWRKWDNACGSFIRLGLCMGDIRDTNLRVKALNRDGFIDWFFLLVDYDSCGEMKQCYITLI